MVRKLFPSSDGPYTWYINDEPIMTRDEEPRQHDSFGSMKIPACVSCNQILNDRFEVPAKVPLLALFQTSGEVTLSADDAVACGLWLAKTWLLYAHPAAVNSEREVNRTPLRPVPEDLWGWMVNGSAPPPGISVWLHRTSDDNDREAEPRYVPLPTVKEGDATIEFQVVQLTVCGVKVEVVYHPDWAIEHPLEVDGRAIRMWPRPVNQPANISRLARVPSSDTRWLRGPTLLFTPGRYDPARLRPLSAQSGDWINVTGVEAVFA